jgi:hypothetical protein
MSIRNLKSPDDGTSQRILKAIPVQNNNGDSWDMGKRIKGHDGYNPEMKKSLILLPVNRAVSLIAL